MSNNNSQFIIQSHEDRLQTLEQVVTETRENVSVVDTHVEHLTASVTRQHEEVLEKLKDSFESIHRRLSPIEDQVNKVVENVDQQEERIEKLRLAEAIRTKRNVKIRNVLIGLSVTAATGLAAKGGDLVWKMLLEMHLIAP